MKLLNMKLVLALLFLSLTVPASVQAADEKLSMRQLLEQVRQGRAKDAATNKAREQAFLSEKAEQETKIRQAMAQVATLEAKSTELEQRFNQNELLVEEKRQQRDERLGSLKELFGHLTGAAGDMRSRFKKLNLYKSVPRSRKISRRLDQKNEQRYRSTNVARN